jgi:hypothetical protein
LNLPENGLGVARPPPEDGGMRLLQYHRVDHDKVSEFVCVHAFKPDGQKRQAQRNPNYPFELPKGYEEWR